MSVTREQVLQVAALARLQVNESELSELTAQLNGILAHMAVLSGAVTGTTGRKGDAAEWPVPLRDDVAGADPLGFPPAELSDNWEAGFFSVPRLAALDTEAK
jgi:aspartyl-tRNA(Asn)/glutamyl-tRNA(Gln) amidotransferase subunit C